MKRIRSVNVFYTIFPFPFLLPSLFPLPWTCSADQEKEEHRGEIGRLLFAPRHNKRAARKTPSYLKIQSLFLPSRREGEKFCREEEKPSFTFTRSRALDKRTRGKGYRRKRKRRRKKKKEKKIGWDWVQRVYPRLVRRQVDASIHKYWYQKYWTAFRLRTISLSKRVLSFSLLILCIYVCMYVYIYIYFSLSLSLPLSLSLSFSPSLLFFRLYCAHVCWKMEKKKKKRCYL